MGFMKVIIFPAKYPKEEAIATLVTFSFILVLVVFGRSDIGVDVDDI